MSQQIPLNTLLGDRYKVTAHVLKTATGDTVLDGLDTVLGRKVSLVLAAPEHTRLLVANARNTAALSRATVQVLDLGNTQGGTYLVTSHARPDTLLDVLLTEHEGSTEEFGEEIFGDSGAMTAPNTYVVAKDKKTKDAAPQAAAAPAAAATAASISATRSLEPAADEPGDFEEYDAEEEGYYEGDEPAEKNGGRWIVGIAAALLLVMGAGAVFASLGNMVTTTSKEEALGNTSVEAPARATAASSADASPTASPTPTEEQLPDPRLDGTFARVVPASPNLMAESDALLGNLTDGNDTTAWTTLGFGSANFGGLVDSFYLSAALEEPTTVNTITINQISGTGGAFTIFANDSNTLDGATEIGSGTFATPGETTIELNQEVQDGETEYIIIQFTSTPLLSQPIVANYNYGLRLAEISIN